MKITLIALAVLGFALAISILYLFFELPLASAAFYLTGITILGLEILAFSFGFLTFIGVSSILFGWLLAEQPDVLPLFMQTEAALAALVAMNILIIGLACFLIAKTRRTSIQSGQEALLNQTAVVTEWQGHQGTIMIEGELWQARSDEALQITPQDRVIIKGFKGMTVIVKHSEERD